MAETEARAGPSSARGKAPQSVARGEEATVATPMIAQYLEIKAANTPAAASNVSTDLQVFV